MTINKQRLMTVISNKKQLKVFSHIHQEHNLFTTNLKCCIIEFCVFFHIVGFFPSVRMVFRLLNMHDDNH